MLEFEQIPSVPAGIVYLNHQSWGFVLHTYYKHTHPTSCHKWTFIATFCKLHEKRYIHALGVVLALTLVFSHTLSKVVWKLVCDWRPSILPRMTEYSGVCRGIKMSSIKTQPSLIVCERGVLWGANALACDLHGVPNVAGSALCLPLLCQSFSKKTQANGITITPISLANASLVIMASMVLLQKGMKRGRSTSECQIWGFPAMHHAFCTLVLCS